MDFGEIDSVNAINPPTINFMDDDETSVDLGGEEPPLAYSEAVEEPLRESWWAAGRRAGLVLVGCFVIAAVVVLGWRESTREIPESSPVSSPASTARASAPSPEPAAPRPVLDVTSTAEKMADPPPLDPDSIYLRLLSDAGVTAPTRDKAIANGHLICQQLAQGNPLPVVMAEVDRINPSLGTVRANGTVWAAVDAYCPQYDNRGQR